MKIEIPICKLRNCSSAGYNSAFAMLNSWRGLYCVATILRPVGLDRSSCTTIAIIVSSISAGSIGDEPFIGIYLSVHDQTVDLLNGNS